MGVIGAIRRTVRVTLEIDGTQDDVVGVAGAPWESALPEAAEIRVLDARRSPSGRCVVLVDDDSGRWQIPVGPFITREAAEQWHTSSGVQGRVERLWEPVDFADMAAQRAMAGAPVHLYALDTAAIAPPTALLELAGLRPGCLVGALGLDLQTEALIGPFVDDMSCALYVGSVIGREVAPYDVIAYPVYRPHDYATAAHILRPG